MRKFLIIHAFIGSAENSYMSSCYKKKKPPHIHNRLREKRVCRILGTTDPFTMQNFSYHFSCINMVCVSICAFMNHGKLLDSGFFLLALIDEEERAACSCREKNNRRDHDDQRVIIAAGRRIA